MKRDGFNNLPWPRNLAPGIRRMASLEIHLVELVAEDPVLLFSILPLIVQAF